MERVDGWFAFLAHLAARNLHVVQLRVVLEAALMAAGEEVVVAARLRAGVQRRLRRGRGVHHAVSARLLLGEQVV